MLSRLVLLAASCALTAAAAPTAAFPPLEQWKTAVTMGNLQALEGLYSRQPPAHVLLGKSELPSVEAECRYWTSLKQYGVSDINPKVLSIESSNGKTQIVLRVDAKAQDKRIVASLAQLWVQQLDGWHLAITQRSDFGLDAARTLPEPAKPNPSLYPPPSEAPAELRAAYSTAARQHKRVLVVFGANWCYDCHVLDSTFHSPAFASLVQSNYVVVHINIGDDGKDNNDLAAQYGVPVDQGVPDLAILEADGKLVVAQQGEFKTTSKIGPSDVRSFLEKWKPRKPA